MKIIIFFLGLMLSNVSLAKRFTVQLDSFEEGRNGKPHLLFMSDGRVGFLDSTDTKSLLDIKQLQKDTTLEVELDKDHHVLSMRSVAPLVGASEVVEKSRASTYQPTLVSLATGKSVFSYMRRDYQRNSQCYNRAHIWTYEEYRRSRLKFMKVFMFFTSRYIRNYNYKWWFHVTPAVQTANGLRTLDRRYNNSLLSLKSWSDTFVYSRRACPVVNKYSDYRNNQYSQDCYHIPVSMYFWQPRDIEERDRSGYEKTSYISWEVEHAYWEAF